jgi:hypothetical protein
MTIVTPDLLFTGNYQTRLYADRRVSLSADILETLQRRSDALCRDPYFDNHMVGLYAGFGVFGKDDESISLFDSCFLHRFSDRINGLAREGKLSYEDSRHITRMFFSQIYDADVLELSLEGILTIRLPAKIEKKSTIIGGNVCVAPNEGILQDGSFLQLRRA